MATNATAKGQTLPDPARQVTSGVGAPWRSILSTWSRRRHNREEVQ
jgi:hypothetical protein